MSKLILPSPVVLASKSWDVDDTGVGPAGATLDTAGTISPLRFLVPANSTVKDSSIDIEILVTSSLLAGNYTLQPKLIFTDPDGVSNAINYVMQAMTITPATELVTQLFMTIAFAKGASGAVDELKPLLYMRGVSSTNDGTGAAVTSLNTGSYATSNSPTLTDTTMARAITVQFVRAGAGASVMNVRYIRAIGYNLNMDNWTI